MLTLLRRHRARRSQAGMTVIELSIASALLLVVATTLFGVLTSLTNNDATTQNRIKNEQNVRFVFNDISRDLRASNPMDTFTTKSTYSNQVQMELGATSPKQVVRWKYDTTPGSPTYESLLRQVMSDSTAAATVVSSTVRLTHVRNVESGQPVFSYFGQHQADLMAGSFTAADVGNCSTRVRVLISADSFLGPKPFVGDSGVGLRNRTPGGVTCG